MTPDTLLINLRDIELPSVPASATDPGYSWIPFIALCAVLLVILLGRYRRARLWLMQARQRLEEIESSISSDNPQSLSRAASALLDLSHKLVRYRSMPPLPQSAYLPPQQIEAQHVRELIDYLWRVLGR